jgi:Zn-dependent membrane protease YugP
MPYFYYGFDPYYIYLVLPAILLCSVASILVKSTFAKFSKMQSSLSGAEAAQRVLEMHGIHDVKIERVSGNLTDHYDPKKNVIRLSSTVYDARSVAAVGVASHEAGHAVQYAKSYLPIKLRAALYPVCNLGSRLSLPLILFGIIFDFTALSNIGIAFFAVALLFQLVTLPVEFNASRRAITAIRENHILLDDSQIKGARKVLTAAAFTYITSFLLSLMQLVRFLLLTNRRRR